MTTGRDIYDGLQWVTHELVYHYDGDGRDYFDEHYDRRKERWH